MGMKTKIPGDGPLVPLKHVNPLLHLGLSTSYAMIREGRYPLPTVTVGRRHHVRREALEAFIAGGPSAEPRRADQERAAVEGRPPDLRALFPNLDEAAAKVRATEVQSALAAAIAEIIETVSLTDEVRERLTELMGGGANEG